jgi:hypothetical protein
MSLNTHYVQLLKFCDYITKYPLATVAINTMISTVVVVVMTVVAV